MYLSKFPVSCALVIRKHINTMLDSIDVQVKVSFQINVWT